jgi:integrase
VRPPIRRLATSAVIVAAPGPFREYCQVRRLSAAEPEPSLLPLTDDEIQAVEQAITLPGQRLIVALAAVHAARWKAIQALTLDDLDLPNRRITIAGHPQRLGDLSHQALRAWLDYRRATWPHTPPTGTP